MLGLSTVRKWWYWRYLVIWFPTGVLGFPGHGFDLSEASVLHYHEFKSKNVFSARKIRWGWDGNALQLHGLFEQEYIVLLDCRFISLFDKQIAVSWISPLQTVSTTQFDDLSQPPMNSSRWHSYTITHILSTYYNYDTLKASIRIIFY